MFVLYINGAKMAFFAPAKKTPHAYIVCDAILNAKNTS
jgi:hypothetical protein